MSQFTNTFAFFFSTYRYRTILVICLLLLGGLSEAIGVAAFLPFFQVILESGDSTQKIQDSFIGGLLASAGVSLSFSSLAIFIAGAIALKAVLLWLAMRKVSETVTMIAADMRWRLMRGLLSANWKFFTGHALGNSLNAVVMETLRSSNAFVSMTKFFAHIIQFLIYAIGAMIVSWKIFVGGIVIGLLLTLALWHLVRVARRAGLQQTIIAKDMLSRMADMLQGIKALRAMSLEGKFFDLLGKDSKGLEQAQFDQLTSGQSLRIFHEPLMVMTALLGLYVAVTFGSLTSSELALIAVLFIRLLTAINSTQLEYQRMATQESALWSLMNTIEKTEAAADNWPGHDDVPETITSIFADDVSFAHGDAPILSHANLNFEPYKMTALIGESGSGKTTMLDLLSGFYLPASGKIHINDKTLDQIDLNQWRNTIGFVPQEVFLFNDTILENILMGRKKYTEEDAWKALDSAGAREFVESLPNGILSSAGENGRLLSGGQRQRIAIARAIVHQPQVLLLDEATSALDPETERVLLETLKALSANMTVIFISHNKTVLDYADKVYKLENGTVKEEL